MSPVELKNMALKNFSIRVKIALGFTIILILFSLSMAGGFYNFEKIWSSVQLYRWSQQLVEKIQEADRHQEKYLFNQKDAYLTEFASNIQQSLDLISQFRSNPILQSSEMQGVEQMVKSYNAAFDQIVENTRKLKEFKDLMTGAFETVCNVLIKEVKSPIEEKKNQANEIERLKTWRAEQEQEQIRLIRERQEALARLETERKQREAKKVEIQKLPEVTRPKETVVATKPAG